MPNAPTPTFRAGAWALSVPVKAALWRQPQNSMMQHDGAAWLRIAIALCYY